MRVVDLQLHIKEEDIPGLVREASLLGYKDNLPSMDISIHPAYRQDHAIRWLVEYLVQNKINLRKKPVDIMDPGED